ncbi:glycosyltransferase family 4 protein [Mucilaginibacter segetis]|uniref:Glycosyltransferase family 4 protein n=1 Tax=Mucilaginibacter segetis TaxID=2793071 RepID=A0A934PVY5_9SPHI|nr:glycosyltransferase family 4 protein [Mucilaginibacter segetis]MBK0380652.1 glycosyltransferase family 4 protein [Mucilaginibacter segetis]
MKKLLFVSHDASRTGAPIVLLSFLNWLKQQKAYEISVYLKHGGDLEDNFKQFATTYLPAQKTITQRVVKRVFKKNEEGAQIPSELMDQSFDLVYLNTVVCLDIAPLLKKFKCPVICHVHENDFTINNYYPEFVAAKNLLAVNRFIAVSKSTLHNLVTNYAIPADKISLVYEFIDLDKIKKPSVTKDEVKQELGLTDEFIVGGSGLTSWRKGIDLFLSLAAEINKIQPDNGIKLIWVGSVTHEFSCRFAYEAERLGIKDMVIFTGSKTIPQNYFQLFDVFALTSREDPFPLVAIEAASLNKPILCFEQSGGMEEFVKDGETGLIVPYADVKDMAVKILTLQDNHNRRINMGEQAGKLSVNYDIGIAAPPILHLITQLINGN